MDVDLVRGMRMAGIGAAFEVTFKHGALRQVNEADRLFARAS